MKPTQKDKIALAAEQAEKKAIIEQMQTEFKAFNEQTRLAERLQTDIFVGEYHPGLLPLFIQSRRFATVELFGGVEPYLKLMAAEHLEGLTYNEIGTVFNFIETLSADQCERVGVSTEQFLEIFRHTYFEMAINNWNKNVDQFKEEIIGEKAKMVERLNEKVHELNKLVPQQPNKKGGGHLKAHSKTN